MYVDLVAQAQVRTKLAPKIAGQGGCFSFFDPKDDSVQFFVAYDRDKVVGLLAWRDRAVMDPDYIELSYCEVHKDHRLKGIAKALCDEFLAVAAARSMPVTITPYEEDGLRSLKPLLHHVAATRNVHLHEQGNAQDLGENPDFW